MCAAKKKGVVSGGLSLFRPLWRMLSAALLIFLGGVLFNLDRLGDTGIWLLKYEHCLPRQVRRFLPGGGAPEGQAVRAQTLRGTIISVHDGDTANLLAQGSRYKIRFYAIDAPEIAQSFGIEARDVLREKILGREVSVEVVNVDQYGRAVGKVYRDSRFINLEMVAEGWAWYYEAYARGEGEFRLAALNARQKQLGLWKSASPRPPWEFRHGKK